MGATPLKSIDINGMKWSTLMSCEGRFFVMTSDWSLLITNTYNPQAITFEKMEI